MNLAALRNHITTADSFTTLILLALLALVALSPLFGGHWFFSHEYNDPLQRVIALAHEMRNGDLYPRWISAGYHGHGLPFFNYYSPGFYMAAAWLYAAGIPIMLAMKFVVWLTFMLGAYGVYLWTRPHVNNQGALLAAVIYLFVPYHFVDLYVRGAMSEFTALAIPSSR